MDKKKKRADEKRLMAIDLFKEVFKEGAYAHILLPNKLRESELVQRDRAFVTELSYTTLRHWGQNETIIKFLASRDLDKIEFKVLCILQAALTELRHMRTQDRAVLFEYGEIAKLIAGESALAFINAILRQYTRSENIDQLIIEKFKDDEKAIRAFELSHPAWILDAYYQKLKDWSRVDALARSNNNPPGIDVIAFPSRVKEDDLNDQELMPLKYSYWGKRAKSSFLESKEIKQQSWGVQNEGSQIISQIWTATGEGNESLAWLDLCAGPGGKASFTATWLEKYRIQDSFTANEINPIRAGLIRNRLPNTKVTELDGRNSELFTEKYDRILIDAPCTGLGAIRRRPESRWTKQPSSLKELVNMQRDLLNSAYQLLKPGGIIGYVTCSPLVLETSAQMAEFFSKHKDAKTLEMVSVLEKTQLKNLPELINAIEKANSLQLWGDKEDGDSMYLAFIVKGE